MANPYLFIIRPPQFGGKSNNRRVHGVIGSHDNLAPDIVPWTNFLRGNPTYRDIQLVDVINDFEWTHTPAMGRHEVPFIRLSEYKVNFNSLMQNIRYLLSFIDKDKLTNLSRHRDNQQEKKDDDDSSLWGSTIGKAWDWLSDADLFGTGVKISDVGMVGATSLSKHLHPYYGLYGASPTGFNYYFPYLQSDWKSIETKWGDLKSGSGGIFSGAAQQLFTQEGILGDIFNSQQIDPKVLGTYIERPQMFDYGANAPSVDVTFNLMNTTNIDDVIRNWHLCFLLMYQNLPNKVSKVVLEPPVIYEAEIPGIFYSPYTYISRLKITNRGGTRVMNLPYSLVAIKENALPLEGKHGEGTTQARWDYFRSDRAAKKTMPDRLWSRTVNGTDFADRGNTVARYIETIVPDAYQIDLTLQSLIPESQNLLFHSMLGPGTLNSGIYTASVQDEATRNITADKDTKKNTSNQKSEELIEQIKRVNTYYK